MLGFLYTPDVWPALLVRWELALLEELGFGLDPRLLRGTGATADRARHVLPKSGRAVSAEAGEPYKNASRCHPSCARVPAKTSRRMTCARASL